MDGSCRARTRLSVVLPARDEEANIEHVVATVLARASGHVSALEIVVVDDGSRDRTAARAEALARELDPVRVVRHARPRGYGAALRSGFAAARHETLFVTDADGQFPLLELPRALEALDRVDAVIGYRIDRADGVGRRLLGRAWTMLADRALGVRARDVNCAFKLFPKRILAGKELRSDGAAVSAELLRAFADGALRVHEMPVQHRPRLVGVQRGARFDVAVRALVELADVSRRAPR